MFDGSPIVFKKRFSFVCLLSAFVVALQTKFVNLSKAVEFGTGLLCTGFIGEMESQSSNPPTLSKNSNFSLNS